MKKKTIVTLLASATVCLALAGCSVGNTSTASAPQQTDSAQTTDAAQTTDTAQTTDAAQTAEAAPTVETEGEVNVVLDDGVEKYEGNWYDEIAGRGAMDIAPSGDGKYYIQVNWGSSAAETSVWTFTAIYDSASGDLVYDDGLYQDLLFDENGDETVTEEKSVHGVLHLTDDGKIEWTDSAFDSSEPSVFVK